MLEMLQAHALCLRSTLSGLGRHLDGAHTKMLRSDVILVPAAKRKLSNYIKVKDCGP